jgi:hypothetical protein
MYLDIDWIYFCIVFGTMLFISFIMNLQSASLYTMHVVMRRFTIIDLEFPASAGELVAVIKGIFLLPPELSKKSQACFEKAADPGFYFYACGVWLDLLILYESFFKKRFFRPFVFCDFSLAAVCCVALQHH